MENEFGSWRVDSQSVAIDYSRVVLQDIHRAAEEEPVHDVAGILFGTYVKDAVRILAHRPLTRETPGAPLSPLPAKDQSTLLELLRASLKDPQLKGFHPVGWYHAQPGEVRLSPGDLAVYNRYFPVRWQIALVLGIEPGKPARGGFFFREKGGGMRSESPYSDFPVGSESPPAEQAQPAGMTAPDESEPLPPPARTFASTGPTVKEGSSRSRSYEPQPPASWVPPAIIPEPRQRPIDPEDSLWPPPLREDPKPAEPAIPDAEFLPIEEREIPVPAADEPEAVLSAVLQDEPEPQTAVPEFQSWEKQVPASKARLVGISLAAILAVMVVGYLVHGRATAPSAQPAVTQGAGLALKVEKDGSTLRVSWDPNALPIKKAIRGVLSITDGIRGEHMNLSVNELESGSVIYAPMGIDVNFQLSVYASETRSVAESVRFVAPRPSPLAEPPAVKPADTKPVLATPPPAALTSRPASQPPPRATFTEPPAPAPPPVTHEAATIAPPPVEGKAAAPEAPPVAVAAKPLAATVQQPPRAIRNVQPTIPQSMKQQMVGSLTVEVRVKVDANGEVVDAVATSTNKNNKMSGYLENRSAQAARLWKFEPATLNGKKVASETTIEFKF